MTDSNKLSFDNLLVGMPLTTLNGERVTNAIITGLEDRPQRIHVLSDFGNPMTYSYLALWEFYAIPQWYFEKLETDYPMPTVAERIDMQIARLQQAKNQFPDEFKTSQEWNEKHGYVVLDPDGRDRQNFDYSFNAERISEPEFLKRISLSTVMFKTKK